MNAQEPSPRFPTKPKQQPRFYSEHAIKKLQDLYIQTLFQIQNSKQFEKLLEFLCSLYGSFELDEGVDVFQNPKDSVMLFCDGIDRKAADVLFPAYSEFISPSQMSISASNHNIAMVVDHYERRIEKLERQLHEKSQQLQEVVERSKSIISSLLDAANRDQRKRKPSFDSGRSSNFSKIPEEEEEEFQAVDPKTERVSRRHQPTPSIISLGESPAEDERPRPLHPTTLEIRSSHLPMHEETLGRSDHQILSSKEGKTTQKKALPQNSATEKGLIEKVNGKVSQIIKYTIHISSLSVIIALIIFSVSAVVTRIGLDNLGVMKLELVDQAICSAVDPAKFMKDLEYVTGPTLIALSVVSLAISIANYGLRLALENLKAKCSSSQLFWILPLFACIFEMVAVMFMFKGKNTLSDLQMNLFKMISMDCVKYPDSAVTVFNELCGIFGEQLMFTVVGAILSIYQLVFYISNVFVIDFMQSLKQIA